MLRKNTFEPGFSFKRPLWSYSKVNKAISTICRNKRFFISKNVDSKEYLDLGCGPNTHDDFINLDYNWNPDIDVCWDATRGLPFADSSLKGVFTEHCLEHLELSKVNQIIAELWRVLKPGGTVRIIVPDGELYLRNYVDIQNGLINTKLPYYEIDSFDGLYTPIMSVNRIFRAHGHVFIFDFQTLFSLLERNRFIEINKQSFMIGRDKKLLLDSDYRSVESLYVEAVKPLGD